MGLHSFPLGYIRRHIAMTVLEKDIEVVSRYLPRGFGVRVSCPTKSREPSSLFYQ